MTTEIWTIIGTGIALAGLILVTLRNFTADIKADIKALDDRVRNQGERMARLEGLLEGLREAVTGRRNAV